MTVLASSREAKAGVYDTNIVNRSSQTNNANRMINFTLPFKVEYSSDFIGTWGPSTNDEVSLTLRDNPVYDSNNWSLVSSIGFTNGIPNSSDVCRISGPAVVTNLQAMQAPYPFNLKLSYNSARAGMEMPVRLVGQNNSTNPFGFVERPQLFGPSNDVSDVIAQPIWKLSGLTHPCTGTVTYAASDIPTLYVDNVVPEPTTGLLALLGLGAVARKKGWLTREYESQKKDPKYR